MEGPESPWVARGEFDRITEKAMSTFTSAGGRKSVPRGDPGVKKKRKLNGCELLRRAGDPGKLQKADLVGSSGGFGETSAKPCGHWGPLDDLGSSSRPFGRHLGIPKVLGGASGGTLGGSRMILKDSPES